MDPNVSETTTRVLGMETLFQKSWKPRTEDELNSPMIRAFSLFGHLPVVLRLTIWDLALMEGRVVHVDIRRRLRQWVTNENEAQSSSGEWEFFSRTRVPALLHTCSESRTAALRPGRYELAFGGRDSDAPPKIYFNFLLDTVHFSSTPIKYFDASPGKFQPPLETFEQHVPVSQTQRIRSIAMDFRPSNSKMALELLHKKMTAGTWQALRVVSLDAEQFTHLQFLAGVEFADISENHNDDENEVQIYGRVFTRDSLGVRLAGRVKEPMRNRWDEYGNLKMLLLRNRDVDMSDLMHCVLNCGFQELCVVLG